MTERSSQRKVLLLPHRAEIETSISSYFHTYKPTAAFTSCHLNATEANTLRANYSDLYTDATTQHRAAQRATRRPVRTLLQRVFGQHGWDFIHASRERRV